MSVRIIEGIEHVQAPEKLLGNAVRCLTADGVALISTPNWKNIFTRLKYLDSRSSNS